MYIVGHCLQTYQQSRYYSVATEEQKLNPETAKNETGKKQSEKETVKGPSEKREFQAETRMLLDIVARSLYSDKEVFNIIFNVLAHLCFSCLTVRVIFKNNYLKHRSYLDHIDH